VVRLEGENVRIWLMFKFINSNSKWFANSAIPIGKVEITEGPNQIQREDAKRRIVVGFNVRGRDVQSIVKN
jgi:cobalt-zinc-cadmium resistance protein CzcA